MRNPDMVTREEMLGKLATKDERIRELEEGIRELRDRWVIAKLAAMVTEL